MLYNLSLNYGVATLGMLAVCQLISKTSFVVNRSSTWITYGYNCSEVVSSAAPAENLPQKNNMNLLKVDLWLRGNFL